MLNWNKLVENYKDSYLKDLKALISIDSQRDDAHATSQYPLGPGPAKALAKYLEFGKRDGFTVKNLDNLVGYIEYGSGDKTLGILAHADVMPAGKGWETNPFDAVIKNGNIIGRGSSDDKGPGLASYYGLKILKDNGIKPKCKIRLIIGTDEESDWTGIKHYLKLEPEPTFGFSPDAEFPLINGEKGIVSFETTFKNSKDNKYISKLKLINFNSGDRDNAVPRDAYALVETNDNEQLATDFTEYLDAEPLSGDSLITNEGVKLHVVGKAAHGMAPEQGINAGTYLASFLSQYDLMGDAHNFVNFIAKYLHLDSRAHHLKLNYSDDKMGELTMNVGIMKFTTEDGGMINTNFRYPKGIDANNLFNGLSQAAQPLEGRVSHPIDDMTPHYVSVEDPIVKTLLGVYRTQSGDKNAQPEVVGGGTYARTIKRGVAFGALFPNTPDTMHQANEFQPIKDLLAAIAIYAQSIYELTK